ncbi:MAG: TRAP transporter small permease subunit [Atribacterota bacterium]|nr:TRAP transporter small permease subunit [Atribacterota bacterium]
MNRFIHKINRIMADLSGISLGLIMIFVLADVVSRTISKPLYGVAEMAIFAMVICAYLGLPYCEEVKGHLRVEVLLDRVSPKYKKILNFVSYFLVFAIFGIVVYSVGKYALSAYNNKESIPGLRPLDIYPIIFVIFISCLFYWIQIGLNLLEKIKELFVKG